MHKVIVPRACGCFNRSEYTQQSEFDTKEAAYEYALDIVLAFEDEFCQKHFVQITEQSDDLIITMK